MMTIEEAKSFFAKDLFAMDVTGITIDELEENYVKCSFLIEEKHQAAHGGVMGGAIFTLADFSFAVAANSSGKFTMTTDSTIHYLGQPKGKKLISECRVIKDGKTNCLFDTIITDENGNLVASVTTGGMHLAK